jgi:hypothetical protein
VSIRRMRPAKGSSASASGHSFGGQNGRYDSSTRSWCDPAGARQVLVPSACQSAASVGYLPVRMATAISVRLATVVALRNHAPSPARARSSGTAARRWRAFVHQRCRRELVEDDHHDGGRCRPGPIPPPPRAGGRRWRPVRRGTGRRRAVPRGEAVRDSARPQAAQAVRAITEV